MNKSISSPWLLQNAALLRYEMWKSFCQFLSFILNLWLPAHLKALSAINPGSWILARRHRLFVWYRSINHGWKPCVYIASVMHDDSDLCGTVHVQRAGTREQKNLAEVDPKTWFSNFPQPNHHLFRQLLSAYISCFSITGLTRPSFPSFLF